MSSDIERELSPLKQEINVDYRITSESPRIDSKEESLSRNNNSAYEQSYITQEYQQQIDIESSNKWNG